MSNSILHQQTIDNFNYESMIKTNFKFNTFLKVFFIFLIIKICLKLILILATRDAMVLRTIQNFIWLSSYLFEIRKFKSVLIFILSMQIMYWRMNSNYQWIFRTKSLLINLNVKNLD